MTLAVGAALYAALFGQAGIRAVTPSADEVALVENRAFGPAAATAQQALPLERGTGQTSSLQVLPSLSELSGVPAPQVTSTAETRVEALNRSLKGATPAPSRPECEPGASPAYCVYTVREGDTLSGIAARFDLKSDLVPGWELLVASNKPNLVSAEDFIQPGQKLRIPVSSGVVHTVLLGESVGDLANLFDVTSEAIVRANGISDRDLIAIGQVLLIPEPKRIPPPASEAATASTPEAGAPGPAAPEPTPTPRNTFVWPITATARISNYFSARHPLGIDLGLSHAPGSAVVAVAGGKVVFAGGDACCSYGYYVIVDHENGLKTLYAHLRSIVVSVGQRVTQGQTLGPSGSTGYSTGVHLHFEVHRNGVRVDPLTFLP